jgi:peptidoglycan/LPS O-acetylase OafA/YrhL
LRGGFIGVDVFFVISGFLITRQIVVDQTDARFTITSFYRRRARRILPALTIVMAATLIIGWVLLLPIPYEKLAEQAVAGALFYPNFLFWSQVGYFDTTAMSKPLLHLWSLGVEEQFYLVWPLLLIVLRRSKMRPITILAALCAASFIYSSAAVYRDPAAAFYSPASRLWELGVGALLAVRPLKISGASVVSAVGLIAIIGSALAISAASPFPGLLAMVPVAGTAAIIGAPSPILRQRHLVQIGLISYPLYLWHWPFLSFAAIEHVDGTTTRIGAVLLSVVLARLTTSYIEHPIRLGALKLRGAALSFAALGSVATVAAAIFFSAGAPIRFPSEIRPVLATMDYHSFQEQARASRCWWAANDPFEKYLPECRIGRTLVWGDSYSALLATGLTKPYAQFTRDGCLPLITDAADACAISNRQVLTEISRLHLQRIILFSAWLGYTTNLEFDKHLIGPLIDTLRLLRNSSAEIILIGPSPRWSPTLPEIAFQSWKTSGSLPDRAPMKPDVYRNTDFLFREIADREGARFISIADILCNESGCLTHTDTSRSQLLAFDDGHFTLEGADFLMRRMGLKGR